MTGFKRQLGITLLQKYLLQETAYDGDKSEKDLYTYYQGQWHKFINSLDMPEASIAGKETRLLIEYLMKLNTNDSTVLKLILLLQLSDPLPWLSSIHSVLVRLKSIS